jgi:hypothetical protein
VNRAIEVVVSARPTVQDGPQDQIMDEVLLPEDIDALPRLSRSQQLKQARKVQNIKRRLQGLQPLPLKRNRGVKDRERSKLRALKFTLSREGLW